MKNEIPNRQQMRQVVAITAAMLLAAGAAAQVGREDFNRQRERKIGRAHV